MVQNAFSAPVEMGHGYRLGTVVYRYHITRGIARQAGAGAPTHNRFPKGCIGPPSCIVTPSFSKVLANVRQVPPPRCPPRPGAALRR